MVLINQQALIKTVTETNLITTENSDFIEIPLGIDEVSINVVIDVNTPAAAVVASSTGVDIATEILTSNAAHDFTTGLKVRATTSSALPTGISLATDYFVIVVSTTTFKLATSLALAQAGTALDITAIGTGNQTFTPSALAGATIKIQMTNDISTSNGWVDGPAANAALAAVLGGAAYSITADAAIFFRLAAGDARFLRLVSTSTAGRLSYNAYIIGH